LPQRRFFSGIVPATSRKLLPQFPVADVDRKSKPDGPVPVVDVVEVDVDVVVELDVEEVVEDVVDVVVEDDVDEVVEDVLLVVELEVLVVVVDDVLVVVDDVVEVLLVVDDDVDVVLVDVVVELLVDVVVVLLVDVLDVVELDVEVELVEVELVDDVLVDVLVVVGLVSPFSRSSTQFSTNAWSVAESPVTSQSFGFKASSFATQPFVGSAPPLYLACALSMHMLKFGSVGFPGVSASW
jgi:hypothetical protein